MGGIFYKIHLLQSTWQKLTDFFFLRTEMFSLELSSILSMILPMTDLQVSSTFEFKLLESTSIFLFILQILFSREIYNILNVKILDVIF